MSPRMVYINLLIYADEVILGKDNMMASTFIPYRCVRQCAYNIGLNNFYEGPGA